MICSDGITEFFSSADIIRLIHTAAGPRFGPREAAQAIMMEARRRWVRALVAPPHETATSTYYA